jgi:dTDP-4-dehydrorhamnose reductase
MASSVVVIGSTGQLASELKPLLPSARFLSRQELDLNQGASIAEKIKALNPSRLIIAAAYTQVDAAEDNSLMANQVNHLAIETIGKLQIPTLHISTDYVFDGKGSAPYVETDQTNPLGVYGRSKRDGEVALLKTNPRATILRTGWVYSQNGVNFVKRMIELSNTQKQLRVVVDQIGSPTWARDLAHAVLFYVQNPDVPTGTYHFTNMGVASWYDLAHQTFRFKKIEIDLQAIRSHEYPTKAKRPINSHLDKSKIQKTWGITIPHWQDSLEKCLAGFNS